MQPPPFPEVVDLIDDSAWLGARPGLPEAARRWHADVDPRRAHIGSEAARLAALRVDFRTVAAVARTTVRFVWFTVTGALAALLARARGGDRGPAAVRRASELVRAGGPAYVKAGQFVSTAKGVLPDEWTEAFAWCRDEVPSLAPGTAEQAVADAFGRSVGELFASFDATPSAAASIAQVHAARLPDGTEVMVKVQRPGLRREFEASIRAMAVLAGIADRTSRRARIANLPGFVELFAQLVLEELDFRFEAVNMIDIGLANEGAGTEYCRIPRPIPGLISPAVLVMERVPGVRYTDVELRPGVDGRRIVRLAIQGILEQALVYGVFHGDLHAGNVLIDETGDFSLVDFGIAGRVGPNERSALVRLMLGVARDDAAALVAAISEFGALPPDLDLDQAARASSTRRPSGCVR